MQSFAQLSLSRAQINATTKKIEALEAQKKELTRFFYLAPPRASTLLSSRSRGAREARLRDYYA